MKLIITAIIGNKKIIKTTSNVVPEPRLVAVLEFATEVEFAKVLVLEFNISVELFKVTVELKFNGIF